MTEQMQTPEIKRFDPRTESARQLISELDAYQSSLYPAESNHLDGVDKLMGADVRFLGAFVAGTAIGCGAVKFVNRDYGELKRMYVRPAYRGMGVGRQLLAALELAAIEHDVTIVRLETGIKQADALTLYELSGYYEIRPFGAYQPDPLSRFFEKRLD